MSKAIDKIRATEVKTLKAKGKKPVLTATRWCLLTRPENLTEKQQVTRKEVLGCNLRTVRAYLLKEDFLPMRHGGQDLLSHPDSELQHPLLMPGGTGLGYKGDPAAKK